MRPLIWFRADLRTTDNTALHAACAEATRGAVGAFIISPDEWRRHDWAPVRVEFVLRAVRELSDSLGRLNIPLRIVHAERASGVPKALLELAVSSACNSVHCNIEHEVDERARDETVRALCAARAIPFHAHHDQTVIPPADIRTQAGAFYTVFTPFKRAWLAALDERGGAPAPLAPPRAQPPIDIRADPVPDRVDGFVSDIDPALWPAGQRAAVAALDAFVRRHLESYAERRDLPGADATSRLSPHLAIGAISARQCLHAAVRANAGRADAPKGKPTGPSTWISELVWREFYRHMLVGFPRVCMHRPFKSAAARIRWRDDPGAFQAWAEGRTGFPIVDAGMRQLRQTGWMHNRVRMITAMFLTKDLLIDWRLGERHFMRHLVDGDLANNNGGWQWSASTGADAAPYFRIFNPTSQSRKVDPEGAYIRRYVPELAGLDNDAIHDPASLPALPRSRLDYPEPIVDHAMARDRAIAAFKAIGEPPRARD